jgi:hypothetical protein
MNHSSDKFLDIKKSQAEEDHMEWQRLAVIVRD